MTKAAEAGEGSLGPLHKGTDPVPEGSPHGAPRPQVPPHAVRRGLGCQRVSLRTQTFGPLIVCIFVVFPGAELGLGFQLRPDGLRTSRLSGSRGGSFLFIVGGITGEAEGRARQ